MLEEAAYVRLRGSKTATYDPFDDLPDFLVVDVHGDDAMPLQVKLRSLPARYRYPTKVVFRGLSAFNVDELSGSLDLQALFGERASVYGVDVSRGAALLPYLGTRQPPRAVEDQILTAVRQAEIAAMLDWTESVWKPSDYHFILPSGEHADTFVRMGDVLADAYNVQRVADWLTAQVVPRMAILMDTSTLLPLAKELEIRALRQFQTSQFYVAHVHGYAPPLDILRRDVLACWSHAARAQGGRLLCLVSVGASGLFASRIESILAELGDAVASDVVTLCATSPNAATQALVALHGTRQAGTGCSLCRAGSLAVEIDQQRFTTRVVSGAEVVTLPQAEVVEEYAKQIADLDSLGAFTVHAECPGEHEHLAISIDTRKALMSEQLNRRADEALATLCPTEPDVVVLPHHSDSDSLREWLLRRGWRCPPALPPHGDASAELEGAVKRARRILLCDDAVMTTHTMRALVQYVQRVKGSIDDDDYDLFGFALIARTEDAATWRGLGNRFFINHRRRLKSAWTAHLPAPGRGCPWCYEKDALADIAPRLAGDDRRVVEERLDRLRSPEGLTDHIFLGSEPAGLDAFNDGVHITPQSYLGRLGDAGAYVATAVMMQRIRNDLRARSESLHRRFVVPTERFLRQYTDPVIVAGLLRAAKPRELWSAETESAVVAALGEIVHARQHPALIAEVLWAVTRAKLPTVVSEQFLQFADTHAPKHRWLAAVVRGDAT